MTGSNSLAVNRKPGFNVHNDADSLVQLLTVLTGVDASHIIELSVKFLGIIARLAHITGYIVRANISRNRWS